MTERHCYNCNDQTPDFICFCKELMVCKACICDHLLDNPSLSHKPVPVASEELIQLVQAERRRKVILKLEESEEIVNIKRKAQRALLEKDLEQLQQFQAKAMLELQQRRQQWKYEIDRVCDELVQSITQRCAALAQALEQRLSDLDDLASPPVDIPVKIEDTVLQLSLHMKELDLAAVLKQAVDVELDFKSDMPNESFLYKFFGGTNIIGVFDPKTEVMVRHLSASQKFFHNSCSCITPQGNIYITGGSLTGRSRSDCLVLSLHTETIKEVQQMQVSRRSHASIFHDKFCYVFGGLVDEERTSLCERYSDAADKWESIGQMKERRAYLGCCEFNGLLYIGGGALSSSCEIFYPSKLMFELVTINHLTVDDFCCLVPQQESILIFHGNFRGDVSRWNPVTNQVSEVAEMCYGNSWSSCSPILVGKTLYMLRSDSIFKYDVETGANAYVMRLTKTTKRRLED